MAAYLVILRFFNRVCVGRRSTRIFGWHSWKQHCHRHIPQQILSRPVLFVTKQLHRKEWFPVWGDLPIFRTWFFTVLIAWTKALQLNDRNAQFRSFPVQKTISVPSCWHWKTKKLELPSFTRLIPTFSCYIKRITWFDIVSNQATYLAKVWEIDTMHCFAGNAPGVIYGCSC